MDNIEGNDGQLRELALFAGAGGGILAGHLLGWQTVCAVEYEPYAASELVARQNDGILAPFPIWDDVRTFSGLRWRGLVDVVSGGFPCQDISYAGKGAGITGERSGLWKEMARIIGEVRPRYAFIENSPMLVTRGLDTVLCDLAAMGYDAEWGCISAADCGAPHERDRIWIVASDPNRNSKPACAKHDEAQRLSNVGNPASIRQSGQGQSFQQVSTAPDGNREANQLEPIRINREWPPEPNVGRVADGIPARMERLKALGNAQVPRVAATAFRILAQRLTTHKPQ